MGGRGGESRLSAVFYPALHSRLFMFGGEGATAEDKALKRSVVSRFMAEAKVGNMYRLGGGFGSSGGETIEIVHHSRSSNKLGIRGRNNRAVAMSSENVAEYIKNGATLIKREGR